MSHNKPSRLRFAINLGNAVLAHLGETGKPAGITVELSHRLAIGNEFGAGASAPNSFPILPRVKWWLTPVASTGILPFWPSIRRGKPPCALPRPISPSRVPRWSALIRPARAWPTWIARQPPLTSDKTPHTIYG